MLLIALWPDPQQESKPQGGLILGPPPVATRATAPTLLLLALQQLQFLRRPPGRSPLPPPPWEARRKAPQHPGTAKWPAEVKTVMGFWDQ